MIVLDASVMIAVLDSSDVHSDAARRILVDAADQRVVAHRLTLAESLVQGARSGLTAALATALDTVGVGRLSEPDDPVLLADLRARTGLAMPDCAVILAALRDGAPLATFDRRLAAAAQAEGVVVLGSDASKSDRVR